MNGFSPFDIFFTTQAKALNIFRLISVDILDEHRKHREAELQKLLLETIGGGKHTDASERILPRIDHIAAAVRAFLDHNELLTLCSSNPIIQKLELDMLRKFVRSFQEMEHKVRHTIPDIPLTRWRKESFRDELGQIVSKDFTVYQILTSTDMLSKSGHKHIAEQISVQLMCGHKQSKTSHQQME